MDPINPLDGLAELLRKRVASDAAAKGKRLGKTDASSAPSDVQRPSAESLRRRLEVAIEAIDPDDPARPKKAARLFVESVLAWQFGEALLNDPGFTDLADEVQATLESEPGFVDKLLAAISGGQGKNAR
jgi:hypothetical protein